MCQFKEYNLDCPKCGAPADQARLSVVHGRFSADGMWLQEDGFSPTDAKHWNTEDEMVRCQACKEIFELLMCHVDNRVCHVEEIEMRGLEEVSNGTLGMTTEILGTLMHVTLIRVRDNENHIQVVDGDCNSQDRYNDLCKMDPGGQFHTTQLAGRDGEWVMILTPFQK